MLARNRKIGKGRPVSAGFPPLLDLALADRQLVDRPGQLAHRPGQRFAQQHGAVFRHQHQHEAARAQFQPDRRARRRIGIGQDHHVAFGQHFQPVLQDVHLLGK